MTDALRLTEADRQLMSEKGITEAEVQRQISIIQNGIPPAKLQKSCIIGDGIVRLDDADIDRLTDVHQQAAESGRFMKFVPASGAATRMFKLLLAALEQPETGDQLPEKIDTLLAELPRFAFYPDLKEHFEASGQSLDALIADKQYRPILQAILGTDGLDYARLPKAMLKFHSYPTGSRTALEEHLMEATAYVRQASGDATIHFTISPEHEAGFLNLIQATRQQYEVDNTQFKISHSFQKPQTDTIAVNMDNTPFRDRSGKLIFRPAGHGALLDNLNDLQGDIIFVKNIDNLVPDELRETTIRYKKAIGGYLIELQSVCFQYLSELESNSVDATRLSEIADFAEKKLNIRIPANTRNASDDTLQAFLFQQLNRPIRICGMVKNEGEPGGGPFWVGDDAETMSLQIVETSQIDTADPTQKAILTSATHFNPVDLVCGVRDFRGDCFDLLKFRDPDSGFISHKSYNGKDLKALELPGLWNGAMANWITIFVEVPIITFNPVKTVFDLLRKEHQPQS